MCNKRNSVYHNPHEKDFRIDHCMKSRISDLRARDYNTKACCCGHGRYPETIICIGTWENPAYEFNSKIKIPRKKRFYKKDKDGFYFIPEVMKNKESKS